MTKARQATATITFVDEYAEHYQDLFPDVRSFEQFKYLLVGLLSELKRKTLPAIAIAVGADAQALHHLLAYAPWSVQEVRRRRLTLLRQALDGRSFVLCIDETGDRKKGHTTDYVAHQYIGNLGKLENGIVSVNAYGILDQITFPLLFKVFKPRTRLKPGDSYKTKPALAVELVKELQKLGFHFSVVLADSLYGESSDFVSELEQLHLKYVVAIRSNHGVWLPPGQRVRYTNWRPFERVFSNGDYQTRYIREIVFGQRGRIRYYHLTTDPQRLPPESTWYLMTNLVAALLEAFQTGGGVPYTAYGADLRKGQADLARKMYLNLLGKVWLPAIPDVQLRLQADPAARVADIACGYGWSSLALAQAYPKVHVDGFDSDEDSIAEASTAAAEAGLAKRISRVSGHSDLCISRMELEVILGSRHFFPAPSPLCR